MIKWTFHVINTCKVKLYLRVIRYLNRKVKQLEICGILKAYAFMNLLFASLHRVVTYYKHLIGPPTPSQGICAKLRNISMTHVFLFIIQKQIYTRMVANAGFKFRKHHFCFIIIWCTLAYIYIWNHRHNNCKKYL